ncbi:hypothetical protein CHU98_g2312 [Xylaria longipes]|nr:hypothetical protein CHU98_g2312 [Xylaria longipes]
MPILELCFGIAAGLLLSRALYHIVIHPLASFPGPRLWAVSRLPYIRCLWQGRLHERIKDLHDTYGPVVRIAPDELSFIKAQAWNDIYCGGVGNKGFPKHAAYRNAQTFESLFDASDENHSRLRRLLKTDFFSLGAAREKQVQAYADRLIAQLRTHHSRERFGDCLPADMREWYNFATFDIIGQVVLSEDFGCLDGRAYHPWTLMVLTHFKLSALLMCSRFYLPLITRNHLSGPNAINSPSRQVPFSGSCQGSPPTPAYPATSRTELEANCILLLLAGSDTIATSLISVTHLLCENPLILQRLTCEVRSVAPLESDVNYTNITSNMPYLNAVLRETHRLCPPLANGPARVVGRQAATIAGIAVPPKTAVGVTYFAANRSAQNFVFPDEFLPERWLSSELAAKYTKDNENSCRPHRIFATDARDVTRPFSVGGRDCHGQNLAMVEFRVLLARMIWNFDMKAYFETNNETSIRSRVQFSSYPRWTDQKAYMLWEKENYYVLLKDRQ